MADQTAVEELSEEAARTELAALSKKIADANAAYFQEDSPKISDAEFDALKRRNAAIEERFPHLKRKDSPSDAVGADEHHCWNPHDSVFFPKLFHFFGVLNGNRLKTKQVFYGNYQTT